jgi:hypothetical protein
VTVIVLQATSWQVHPGATTFPDQDRLGTRWDTYLRALRRISGELGSETGLGWTHRCRRLYFDSESVYGHRSTWLIHEDVDSDHWFDSQWVPEDAASMMNVRLT